jgi:hypothetical protein
MSVESMLATAQKYVDEKYRESPGNHTIFGEWYGDNGEPWCDQFVSYVGNEAGESAAIGKFQYCPSHVNHFKSLGQWGSSPRVGALVFYDWDGDGLADHVGIVKSFDANSIRTLEGNTSSGDAGSQGNGDGAYERVRPRNGNIMGYAYPAYAAGAAAPSKPAPAPAPAKPPAVTLSRVLVNYCEGSDVRAWQTYMHDVRKWRGLTVDGKYGTQSEEICKEFQRDSTAHGYPLDVDGKVGPATLRVMLTRPVTVP